MRARLHTENDLETLNHWYKGHGGTGIDAGCLPKIGIIVEDIAAGFLYRTDSDIAFLDNFVSNPNAKPREVYRAINFILEHLTQAAVEMGYKRMFGFTKKDSMHRRAVDAGFKPASEGWQFVSMEVH